MNTFRIFCKKVCKISFATICVIIWLGLMDIAIFDHYPAWRYYEWLVPIRMVVNMIFSTALFVFFLTGIYGLFMGFSGD